MSAALLLAFLCAKASAVEKAAPASLLPASGITGPVAPISAVPSLDAAAPYQPVVAVPGAAPAQASALASLRAAVPPAQAQPAPAQAAATAARAFDGAKPAATPVDAGELGALTGAALTPVAKNVFHLNFPTQHLLAATFLRFQEHYESPKYAGKSFTWEEFMDWYAKENGKFSYLEDWSGFNIPSRVFTAFRKGLFDPLTKKEAALLALFEGVKGRFYVIGTAGAKDDGTLRHEIAHGLFYRDPVYKRRVREILKGVDLAPVHAALIKLGYGPNVLEDEAHAYLGDDLAFLAEKGVDVRPYAEAHDKLLALYRERASRP